LQASEVDDIDRVVDGWFAGVSLERLAGGPGQTEKQS
jgi:hypothetical protein